MIVLYIEAENGRQYLKDVKSCFNPMEYTLTPERLDADPFFTEKLIDEMQLQNPHLKTEVVWPWEMTLPLFVEEDNAPNS